MTSMRSRTLTDTDLRTLADGFGTPLYVFDTRELARRVAYLRARLPATVGFCFAMKANTFVLPAIAGLVDRLEVCSPGELRICRALSIPQGSIVVSGVYKELETIDAALASEGLPAAVTIESEDQMELVARVAAARGVRAPVLLRLACGSQFGLDRALLKELARRYRDNPAIDLRGVQFFSGTQKTSVKRLARELAKLDAFAAELAEELGWMPAELEYGPGLPVSYFEHDDFDEDAFLRTFAELLEGMSFTGKVTLELGRSLVASCGTYLTRVVDTKVNAGQRYAIVDGGMHHLVYYGQAMAMKQPCVRIVGFDGGTAELAPSCETEGERSSVPPAASRADGAPAATGAEVWNVCGSLCTTNDILVKQMPVTGLDCGSLIAFERTGAYCMTEGISLFLSRDLPRVVVLDARGRPTLVRDALRTDLLNTPLLPLG